MSRIKARWLLVHANTEAVTFTDDDEQVEKILDDSEDETYLVIDLDEGLAYESNGLDNRILEHLFEEEEVDPEDEPEDD